MVGIAELYEGRAHPRRILGGELCYGPPDGKRGVGSMTENCVDVESLANEELLSIVLAMVAPAESDPLHEYGLRFDAQRAATELYCRAASARRADRADTSSPSVGTVTPLRCG